MEQAQPAQPIAPSAPPPVVSADGAWAWNGQTWIARDPNLRWYRSAHGWANTTSALLGVWMLSAVLFSAAELTRISVANSLSSGQSLSITDAQNSDSFVRTAAFLNIGVFILTGIAFLIWLHRVVDNNWLQAGRQRFTPGWAVGWWFIPFANLVMPFQVVSEAWQHGHSGRGAPSRVSLLVLSWWVLYLAHNIVGYAAGLLTTGGDIDSLRIRAAVAIVSDGFGVIAAVLAILIVRGLTARQDEKNRQLPKS